ncbi:MAG: DUF1622 domain-containing protein [Anaerolineales bacterium]
MEACGALAILTGTGRTIWIYLHRFWQQGERECDILRTQFGQGLVMALEFQVAADILKTAISPTWDDILKLAATITLRTILNYLLELEFHRLEPGLSLLGKREKEAPEGTTQA